MVPHHSQWNTLQDSTVVLAVGRGFVNVAVTPVAMTAQDLNRCRPRVSQVQTNAGERMVDCAAILHGNDAPKRHRSFSSR
jgi:hypothetical protein